MSKKDTSFLSPHICVYILQHLIS